MAEKYRAVDKEVTDRYELMKEALQACTAVALQAFAQHGPLEVTRKPDGSKVTEYDVALNEQFIAYIKEYFPNDTVIGEEVQYIPDSPNGYVWTHDPIDGTSGFIRNADAGTPRLCTSAGMATLFKRGEPVPCMAGVDRISTVPEFYYQHDGMVAPEFMSPPRFEPERYAELGLDSFPNVRWYDYNGWQGSADLSRIEQYVPGKARRDKVSSVGVTAGRIATGRNDFHLFPGPSTKPHDYAPALYLVGRRKGAVAQNLDGVSWQHIDMHRSTNGLLLARTVKIGQQVSRLLPFIAE